MMAQTDHTIAMRRIDRAVHELRGGYPVLLAGVPPQAWLVISAETMEESRKGELLALAGSDARLVISGIRAARLGLASGDEAAYALSLSAIGADAALLGRLIDPLQDKTAITPALASHCIAAGESEAAALELAKLASLLPAVIVAQMDIDNLSHWAVENHILTLEVADVTAYKEGLSTTLTEVSHAHVPLKLAENAQIRAFRPRYGAVEHLAVCIGEPAQADAPLVRVHSSCVTGDILGSLRCDCGEQLQEAIRSIAAEGTGVVLYLSQEGRGIGIVNKLRAYRLQDAGLDTLDANEEMGFAGDERNFATAAAMLQALGIHAVRLLSNNPDKVAQLEESGITVTERVSLSAPANRHNQRYLETKETRCGHVF